MTINEYQKLAMTTLNPELSKKDVQTAESKRYFREGLIAMLDELEPQVVLVYGSMPNQIFGGLSDRTKFVQFPDWTTRMKTTK